MITFSVKTKKQTELIDITGEVRSAIKKSGLKDGLVCVFVPHTTAAVTINENADPSVQSDILNELNKVIPLHDNYTHSEGNSAGHIKSTLTGCSQLLIVENGQLVLGTWQGIYFCEFDGPRSRQVHIKTVP
ncbi:MAG: secondary thiamine-phosphate synthase enzyme YjbQ [Planctomycetes bacterium]|nr:secondary thiamine-phosphate synthase enzyme YjbQ [Planctomycetota bacterium]MCK5578376.1 secondary thiamine-phosphate synthase enzyme YjbQ [Planctomycetota bacterium]